MRLALIAACLAFPAGVAANPTGGTVTSGSATMSTSGSTLTVTTSTTGTVINWNSFSINVGETTQFTQPSAASVTLNRVTGPNTSSIQGLLQSNGQLFLVNPNGIVFGSTAQVNTTGFVASTLGIADSDFLAGNYHFTGSGGSIVNNGTIVGSDANVALIAPAIQSTGAITAGPGGILIAAADPVTVGPALNIGTTLGSVDIQGTFNTPGPIVIAAGTVTITGVISGPNINITGSVGSGGLINTTNMTATLNGSTFTVTNLSVGGGASSGGSITVGGCITTAGKISSCGGSNVTSEISGAITLTSGTASPPGTGDGVVRTGTTATAPSGAPLTASGVTLNLQKRELSF